MSVLQNFYKATITKNWTATTGDFNVSVAPTPTSGILVVSPNNSTLREIISYSGVGTNAYGPYITVTARGLGGTSAQTHTIGESIRMNITAEHWAEMQADISAIVAAGAPNASTSTRGIVQLLTDTDILANSDTGSTTAKLVSPLSKVGVYTKTVTLSAADILTLNTVPVEIIAAPGAGRAIVLESIVFSFKYNSIAFTSGSSVYPVWSGSTTNIFSSGGNNANISNGKMVGTSNFIARRQFDNPYTADVDILENTAIKIYSGANFATGNSTMKLIINYRVITL